jgi:methionyl-tRNA formyltransferase
MKKIMLLAGDRGPAQGCLDILIKAQREGFLDLNAVASEASYFEKIKKLFNSKVVFLESNSRNEDEIYRVIKDHKIDLVFSIQYRWIISEKMINAVNGFAFNIHFGKLPDYRGHHTHIHPILNGDKSITTTLHWIAPKVDTGFIAFEGVSTIEDGDTSWSLMQKATNDSIRLFDKFVSYVKSDKKIPKIPIKGKGHFYGVNSIFDLKQISSMGDFDEVDKKARAFYYPPHEPAYFILNKQRFYVIPQPSYVTPDGARKMETRYVTEGDSNKLGLFLESEKTVLAKTCEIQDEKEFVVYKHKTFRNYYLGNGILIKNPNTRVLKEWEDIFDKFFDKGTYLHRTFTFIGESEPMLLIKEAQQAKYREANVFPIEVYYGSPLKGFSLPADPKVHKIEIEDDWKRYRKFVEEVHPDNDWLSKEGFDILKKTSDAMNVERFFIQDDDSKKILSIIGIFKCGDIARMENLETHPDFRGRGFALHLVTFASRYALGDLNAKGIVLVSSNNEAAMRLYRKFGFKIIGRKTELVNY